MTKVTVTVEARIENLDQLRIVLENLDSGLPPWDKVFKQWAIRIRSFLQERFDRLSKGGGEWPPLKHREGTILRDTGILFASLSPIFSNLPGQLEKRIPSGIEVGIGGDAAHGNDDVTVAQIAVWHHSGAGILPVRSIVVLPTEDVLDDLVGDVRRVLPLAS